MMSAKEAWECTKSNQDHYRQQALDNMRESFDDLVRIAAEDNKDYMLLSYNWFCENYQEDEEWADQEYYYEACGTLTEQLLGLGYEVCYNYEGSKDGNPTGLFVCWGPNKEKDIYALSHEYEF